MCKSKILFEAVINISNILGINENDLAEIVGLDLTLFNSKEINPDTQALAIELFF